MTNTDTQTTILAADLTRRTRVLDDFQAWAEVTTIDLYASTDRVLVGWVFPDGTTERTAYSRTDVFILQSTGCERDGTSVLF